MRTIRIEDPVSDQLRSYSSHQMVDQHCTDERLDTILEIVKQSPSLNAILLLTKLTSAEIAAYEMRKQERIAHFKQFARTLVDHDPTKEYIEFDQDYTRVTVKPLPQCDCPACQAKRK